MQTWSAIPEKGTKLVLRTTCVLERAEELIAATNRPKYIIAHSQKKCISLSCNRIVCMHMWSECPSIFSRPFRDPNFQILLHLTHVDFKLPLEVVSTLANLGEKKKHQRIGTGDFNGPGFSQAHITCTLIPSAFNIIHKTIFNNRD